MNAGDSRPLIAHIVYRFDVGGLENGVVNLLNHLPRERFRHAVISLTDATDFRQRVHHDDVAFIEMHKAPGHAVRIFPRLFDLFRQLRPAIIHTRNLAALEATVPAWFAGCPVRIHGEHGRDVDDLDGRNRRYRLARQIYRPFVTRYVALSRDLEHYLLTTIKVPAAKVERIVNGVDTRSFAPPPARSSLAGCPFSDPFLRICGTVGRLQTVKNQVLLARAFVRAREMQPALRSTLRLIIVGDGPLRAQIEAILAVGDALQHAWLPGARADVAEVLRAFDLFTLPSRAEGISNTILEAMATGLPVVATDVGGNPELVTADTGILIPADDVDALANAIIHYASNPERAIAHGRAGRQRVEEQFSIDAMVARYCALYEAALGAGNRGIGSPGQRGARAPIGSH
jgi:sugar transferase (PEP-CTERM/EpsH1 system associated)